VSRAELIWFRLKFPHDLDQAAVLAALASFSGLPHPTRLVFDLLAGRSGITHHLAISPKATETVLGSLRAAIPSLRLDVIEPGTASASPPGALADVTGHGSYPH
jgi:hypothetical protein